MKRLMLTAGQIQLSGSAIRAKESLFWVVGNSAANRCAIVTSNPVVTGDIWFADGPYKSIADAKLALDHQRVSQQR